MGMDNSVMSGGGGGGGGRGCEGWGTVMENNKFH